MVRYYSKEQIAMANQTDLEQLLLAEGETLLKSGRDKRWARHTSITVRGNRWYDWKQEKGGYPIEFVKRYYHYDFKKAMEYLLSLSGEVAQVQLQIEPEIKKKFELPQKCNSMKRVYGYLIKQRFIDKNIIDEFVRRNLIYEDIPYHNAVFVGTDDQGTAHHAHKRSTLPYKKSFRGNAEGSDPHYPFHWHGSSNQLYVFEAPVDLLSYLTLNKENWHQHHYLSLNGLAFVGLESYLARHEDIDHIYICVDHDPAGHEGYERIRDLLEEKGYEHVERILPVNKDFNEDLKALHQQSFIRAEDHPLSMHSKEIIHQLKDSYDLKNCDLIDSRKYDSMFADIYYGLKGNDISFSRLKTLSFSLLVHTLVWQQNLHNESGSGYSANMWEYLELDYRCYKDKDNLKNLTQSLFDDMKELKDILNSSFHYKDMNAYMMKLRKMASSLFYIYLTADRGLEKVMKLKVEFGLPEGERPKAKMIGEDGNIFNLMGIASRALKQAGYSIQAREMVNRITTSAESYDEALAIISQYVEPTGQEIDENEMQMECY